MDKSDKSDGFKEWNRWEIYYDFKSKFYKDMNRTLWINNIKDSNECKEIGEYYSKLYPNNGVLDMYLHNKCGIYIGEKWTEILK